MDVNQLLVNFLSQFVTEERLSTFDRVLGNRTRYITVALENIYQPQNASAVIRTCDCFGIQDLHVVENDNEYVLNPDVTIGSDKWINRIHYNSKLDNSLHAIQALKKDGYRIVATTPHTNDVNLHDFDLEKGKVALFFGTELHGVSEVVMERADEFLKIPMYGFTESFNISVSASIILHYLTLKLRNSNLAWCLTEEEKLLLKLDWLRKTIKKVNLLEDKFLNDYYQGTTS